MADQLDSHKDRLRQLSGELSEHSDNPPPRGAKAIVWTNYRSVKLTTFSFHSILFWFSERKVNS